MAITDRLPPMPPIDEPLVDSLRRLTPRWRKYLQQRDDLLTDLQQRVLDLENP